MTLTHVQQPTGSKYCGQACVATIADVALRTAVDAVGKSRRTGTTEHDLRRALAGFGYTLGRFQRGSVSALTGIALVRWRERARKYGYHWIVINITARQVHDPVFERALSMDDWRAFTLAQHARITSWASVWRTA